MNKVRSSMEFRTASNTKNVEMLNMAYRVPSKNAMEVDMQHTSLRYGVSSPSFSPRSAVLSAPSAAISPTAASPASDAAAMQEDNNDRRDGDKGKREKDDQERRTSNERKQSSATLPTSSPQTQTWEKENKKRKSRKTNCPVVVFCCVTRME